MERERKQREEEERKRIEEEEQRKKWVSLFIHVDEIHQVPVVIVYASLKKQSNKIFDIS